MSKIEVNEIVKSSGSTLTIGGCGTAVTLGSGATQTGFGRSGSVNWQTTPKTSTFTAVSGEGYFANTSGGAITMNLPAGSAGAIVSVADYTRSFATHNLTINPNGSEKIGGVADDASLGVNGQALTLVYVDSTEGWINVQNAEDTETGVPPYVAATGGNSTVNSPCGNFKIHTFTSPGTFQVTNAGSAPGSNTIDYVVIGGGGAGGNDRGGGGGAGGMRFFASPDIGAAPTYPAGARNGPAAISASVASFPIVIGAGGAGSSSAMNPGSVSSAFPISSAGGGAGGNGQPSAVSGAAGASGGGGRGSSGPSGGAGNTPPVSPSQGSAGGPGGPTVAGGGGGLMAVGKPGGGSPSTCTGAGGIGGGVPVTLVASNGVPSSCEQYFSGGGAAGTCNTANPHGGLGGGGSGAGGQAGTANTGGGGQGNNNGVNSGGNGGSGIVVIRYKFQN